MKSKLIASVLAVASTLMGGVSAQSPAATKVSHPEWSRNAVIYEVNPRQFTDKGTFKALAHELPRLKELGVDILWFMPIHPISELNRKGQTGSYYAVRNYKTVNPEFGNIDDFRAIVKEAHRLGMKVIIDWVPNHTGCDNTWVTDNPEWYVKDKDGRMVGPYDWTDTYKLDYNNKEMRAAMIDAMQYWLREADIDGFRCDVASEVPVDFWNEARPQLEKVKPGIFMLAEASVPALEEEGFDMAYNWPMKDLFSEIAATQGQYSFKKEGEPMRTFPVKNVLAIDSLLAAQAAEYPADSYMMNMITNHDLNSWEGTEFERLGNLQAAFAVLSYTLPGMPLIYTGQETGMNRAFEFFVKDNPPTWEPRNEYFTFYQTLNNLKHNNKALLAGNAGGDITRYPTKSNNIYAFSRSLDGNEVMVIVNLGNATEKLAFKGKKPDVKGMTDIFTGTQAVLPKTMAPGAYLVFTK